MFIGFMMFNHMSILGSAILRRSSAHVIPRQEIVFAQTETMETAGVFGADCDLRRERIRKQQNGMRDVDSNRCSRATVRVKPFTFALLSAALFGAATACGCWAP
jgi:hypothetical protein